jgi:hypothetical protein
VRANSMVDRYCIVPQGDPDAPARKIATGTFARTFDQIQAVEVHEII